MAKSITVRDIRSGNWFWAHNAILDDYVRPGRLKPLDAMVYFALCRTARDNAAVASVAQLAALAGTKERFTRDALHRLEALGLIVITPRTDADGRPTASAYALRDPAPHAPYPASGAESEVHDMHLTRHDMPPLKTNGQNVNENGEEVARRLSWSELDELDRRLQGLRRLKQT